MERSQRLQKAQDFIWRNARLVERYLFTSLFAGGSREPVLAALRAYQNEDGGFGNALEPDKRCPSSQPQDVEFALHILDAIDAMDDPIVGRACDYLVTITTSEGGVPYALPSVNAYPHADWWTVEDNPAASLNPTAAIAGLLLKHHFRHPGSRPRRSSAGARSPLLTRQNFTRLCPPSRFWSTRLIAHGLITNCNESLHAFYDRA